MEVTIKTSDIDTWDTGVSVGTDLKENLDTVHMSLGVLGLHLCPIRKAGGQDPENQSQTVTALAKAIGIDRSWLSNAISNAQFYAGHYEDVPPQATIGQLNRGRKLTGWTTKLDKPPTKTQIKKAMKYLEGEVDEPAKVSPTAIAYVRGARGKLVRALEHDDPLTPQEVTSVEQAKDELDIVDSHYESEDE
ncbi:hypothetical protein LCGC14_0491040 [marine sediment metagenome]|uniref:Uncharacterized protein n=1 Tax=marine sediment metagenome TaxID=412755 RepID=A0A0F9UTH3_9ZZZZ